MLNAFRHQRTKHFPTASRCPGSNPGVLNAFRHQRTKHRGCGVKGCLGCGMCSTPFGINGRNTTRCTRWEPRIEAVLNAFRHQRTKHCRCVWKMMPTQSGAQRLSASTDETPGVTSNVSITVKECSTPFGINGRNTARRRRRRAAARCAQRLSASTDETLVLAVRCKKRARVLNAFRHQRTKHRREPSLLRRALSAQRLSASTDETRADLASRGRWSSVLNAFRHQRTKHCPAAGPDRPR